MGFLYSNINQTDKNTKQTFKMIIMDIIQTEKRYRIILKYLKRNKDLL